MIPIIKKIVLKFEDHSESRENVASINTISAIILHLWGLMVIVA